MKLRNLYDYIINQILIDIDSRSRGWRDETLVSRLWNFGNIYFLSRHDASMITYFIF